MPAASHRKCHTFKYSTEGPQLTLQDTHLPVTSFVQTGPAGSQAVQILTDQCGDFICVPPPLPNQLVLPSQDAPLPRPLHPRTPSLSCSGAGLQESGKAGPSSFPGLISKARSFLLSEGRQEVALPPLVVHPGQLARGLGT